jgi:formylglycine-generating enzyme required for sulfatase activity
VVISRGFWMGKYEVTQGEYLAVMGSNPSWFSTNNGYAEDLSRPVETVRWDDATNYCASSRSVSGRRGGLRPTVCIGCRPRRSGSMLAGVDFNALQLWG